MIRASIARLGLSFSPVSTTGAVTPPVDLVRVYKGSIVKSSSGNFPKTDLLSLSGTTTALTEIDCEAVGGGASGRYSLNDASDGGTPGIVATVSVAYADLPDTIEFTIGAGGPIVTGSVASGGATSIIGIVSVPVSGTAALSPKDRPSGPGQGATTWTNKVASNNGGKSNASYPDLVLDGGIGSGDVGTNPVNGKNAVTPFQHGSGGASCNVQSPSGNGGWPGGGGSKGYNLPGYSGRVGSGGAGAARFHVYALEPAA